MYVVEAFFGVLYLDLEALASSTAASEMIMDMAFLINTNGSSFI